MKSLISCLIFIILFISCSTDSVTKTDTDDSIPINSKPNILLIIADDMGLDAAPGFNVGSVKPTMPNLQNMINNGVRFNNLWSYPTCTPTRSSILTGKYGFRTNVMKVDDVLSTSETSLQKHLDNSNSGYNHAVIGKWHLSKDALHPTQMGVGYYAGLLTGGVQSYTNWNFTENGQTSNSSVYTTTKFTDLAINWIDKQEKPWFLWLAYNAPHTPFHLPPASLHTQSLGADQASIDANSQPYYMAMLEALDTEMGRLLSSMTQEEKDNTVIIFIGDNGTPNQVVQEYASQRAKGSVYQGGVNVPMIISGKNINRFNESDDALLNTTDLFATISDIAGTGTTEVNDSKSFKELFTAANSNFREYTYTEIGEDNGTVNYTIRNATHKYIKFSDGTEALYNLSLNSFENPNLLNASQLPLSNSDATIKQELITKVSNLRE
ncbi:sulfatase [Tenacibaculum sp. Bg11-29]|uniref:sulfatase-like hydrolase/transferase n=1 Tax=Tenacibaculum sp. Bg11-29 TaxID=2058306 RepID=UPI000C321FBF|nr:sulfatase-like hydrolase/transferase [Tenacibaculum sp. Bg11-29]PKH51190.1 sulfatase [Tenacibaculum sp. Bg11-29]